MHMVVNGFHISYTENHQRKFIFSDEKQKSVLRILPFELFHLNLFSVPVLNNKYPIPRDSSYPLKEVTEISVPDFSLSGKININPSVTKEEYISTVGEIKKHIQRGDIYEMNYCFEFFAENAEINPFHVFDKLYKISSAPFSSLTKCDDLYIICCSPERFLKREKDKIISQPMKGTAPRFSDPIKDEESRIHLKNNPKEQNENVMIVDLVRNDLSKIAKRGSVQVDELFGVRTFSNVHQMISTISCFNNNHSNTEIFESLFPMGSMTGAPKKRTLELINKFEKNARGIYSGAIGIEEENGDFDLAVVIRSIVYDSKNKYLSFSVGSAITAGCNPEKEYDECLLKAKTMMEALNT